MKTCELCGHDVDNHMNSGCCVYNCECSRSWRHSDHPTYKEMEQAIRNMKGKLMNTKRTLTDEQIDEIARTFAALIDMDNADPSPNVPTVMGRIGGAIREAIDRLDELNQD